MHNLSISSFDMNKLFKLFLTVLLVFIVDYLGNWILMSGLNRGYGLNRHSKILIVGHSHLMMGLDRKYIEQEFKFNVTKYTRSGVDLTQRHLMIRQYVASKYSDSLQVAILGVDPFSFNQEGLSANSYTVFYPFMDNKDIGEYVYANTSLIDYYGHKLFRLSRFGTDLLNESYKGWKDKDTNRKTDTLNLDEYYLQKDKWVRNIGFDKTLQGELSCCIRELTARGIHVILLNTPTAKVLNDAQPEKYAKIIEYYNTLASKSESVDFIDYSPEYEKRLDIFFDPIHLNVKGQEEITKRLIIDIKQMHLLK